MEKRLWEFLELVQDMRKKQQDYFRTRDANILQESKDLEKRVDSMAKELQEDRLGMNLFDTCVGLREEKNG